MNFDQSMSNSAGNTEDYKSLQSKQSYNHEQVTYQIN